MSNDDKSPRPEPAAPAEAEAEAPAVDAGGEDGAVDETAAALERLQAENEELRDRLLRTAAEMENLRKRSEREVRDASQYAISGFARDVLGIADNLDRALEAVDPQARESAEPALKSLLDGVEMTGRELAKVLDRHGIERLEPQGERFDPNVHQAMFEVPDETVPSGTVVQVVQAGFTIAGRVLRPAMVGVSKGGPKPGAKTAGDAPDAGGEADGGTGEPPRVDRTA